MKPLNERDLERLLREEPSSELLVPPTDLADRIKAEIPADLGSGIATPSDRDAGPAEVETPPSETPPTGTPSQTVVTGPWSSQRTWALAASLVTLIGAGLLAQRLFVDSEPGSAVVSDVTTETTVGSSRSSAPQAATVAPAPEKQPVGDGEVRDRQNDLQVSISESEGRKRRFDTEPEAPQDVPAQPSPVGEARIQEAERELRLGSDQVLADGDAVLTESVDVDSVLIGLDTAGDGTEQANGAGRRRTDEREAESKLRALGYLGGPTTELAKSEPLAEESPASPGRRPGPPGRPASPAPPPPPPSPPAIVVSELPKPQARESSRFRAQEQSVASAPVERQLADGALEGFVATPSTGGTAEPNDAPYGDMFFRSEDTNPFLDTEDDRLSTFGFDVDTASYTLARRYLRDGHLPDPDGVRVEEFVNYFDYGDTPPAEGDFALHAEGAPSPFGEGDRYYLLRLNASGRVLDVSQRASAQLTFVVDISGSMAQENRLGLVKRALGLLIDQLRPDDRVALVVYGGSGRVLLEPTADHEAIRRAIDRLQPEGSTNAEEGLRLAYELAARHRRAGGINRVILCSDGVANVGQTSAESILERIRRHAEQGIELTTVGFGMGNYNDVLMEQLADRGNGRYAYVDTLDEAHRIFVEDLTGTLQTLAAEARAQVEFDPRLVERYRLLGYENRDIADERFRDDTVDAGEIGMGHRVTALYELKLRRAPRRRDRLATLRLRYASVAAGEMVELERTVTGGEFVARWENASTAFRLTALVAEFAEILRRSYWARNGDLDEVFRRTQRLSGELAGDPEVADLVSLMGRAAEIQRRASPDR